LYYFGKYNGRITLGSCWGNVAIFVWSCRCVGCGSLFEGFEKNL